MQVTIESNHPETRRLRARAMRQMLSVLHLISGQAPRVHAQLTRVDSAYGVDKRCDLSLTTSAGERSTITTVARNWRLALKMALAKLRDMVGTAITAAQPGRALPIGGTRRTEKPIAKRPPWLTLSRQLSR